MATQTLNNLPAQVSSFIGRDGELAEVRALVGSRRLVTLTGTGGAGKTRLALQVAAGLADNGGDGAWFADLASLGDPDQVAVTVADVLGVRQEPGRPVLDTLVEAVGGRSLLVVLDNCEHVIGACAKVGQMLGNLGNFELAADDPEAARDHLAESLDIARELNSRDGIVYGTFNLGLAEYLAGTLGAAGALFAESLGLARRIGLKLNMAYALLGLAMAGRSGADPGWSARVHGASDQAMADQGHAFEPFEGGLADRDRQRLRAAMGEAFDAEYAAGRNLDPAEVLPEAGRKDTPAVPGRAVGSREAALVLTPRELDVLKLVAQGSSNADIARRLFLSEHTVHRHLANIPRKLHLSSRAAAAAWGVRSGLV